VGGRFRAAATDTEHYLLPCCRNIELNTVPAGTVESAGEDAESARFRSEQGSIDPEPPMDLI